MTKRNLGFSLVKGDAIRGVGYTVTKLFGDGRYELYSVLDNTSSHKLATFENEAAVVSFRALLEALTDNVQLS